VLDIPDVGNALAVGSLEAVGRWADNFHHDEGPSQGAESLCIPLVLWMRRRTMSPTLKDCSRTLRL
jgi:hypothetical protein